MIETDLLGRCTTRPVRIAFLIQAGEHIDRELDGIFAESYRRWGGRFSLIVPCEDSQIPDLYWPWLKAYDPDVIYSYVKLSMEEQGRLHERVGPSILEIHRPRQREDVFGYTPSYGTDPLQSLSTVFKWSRHGDHRRPRGPISLIDAWYSESPSRFLTDNFGTYHQSYGTSTFPNDAMDAVNLLTLIDPAKVADGRLAVPKDLETIPDEATAFRMFAERKTSSLSIASMMFSEKMPASKFDWADSFCLVVGSSYSDRVLFWNSRLHLPNWIGSDLGALRIDPQQTEDENFIQTLATLINRHNFLTHGSQSQARVTLRSTSIDSDRLERIAEKLRKARCWSSLRVQEVSNLSQMVPSAKELERSAPTEQLGTPFNRLTQSRGFKWKPPVAVPETAIPEHLEDAPYRQAFAKGIWATECLLHHGEEASPFGDQIWRLPRRWRTEKAFKIDFSSSSRSLALPQRSSRIGNLTYFENVERTAVSIRVPSGRLAILYALSEEGQWAKLNKQPDVFIPMSPTVNAEASNEARYLNGVLGMAGTLESASLFLLHPFMQQVFRDLGGNPKPPSEKLRPTIDRLRKAGRGTATFDLHDESELVSLANLVVKAAQGMKTPLRHIRYPALSDRWRSYRELVHKKEGRPEQSESESDPDWEKLEQDSLNECLTEMRQRQLLFQGHEWLCPECHYRNWVNLADLNDTLICAVCRHDSEAPIAFDWLFRPNPFLIEALRDHSTLSLLWVLHTLRRRARSSFIYAGPHRFWYEDWKGQPDAEADLLAVVDQRTIMAEVKSSWSSLRKEDIRAFGEIAKRLRPDAAILAIMDTGSQHVQILSDLGKDLGAEDIQFEIMTLDTSPLADDPHLW